MMRAAGQAGDEEAARATRAAGAPLIAVTGADQPRQSGGSPASGRSEHSWIRWIAFAELTRAAGLDGVVAFAALETARIRGACGPRFAIVTQASRRLRGASRDDQARTMTPRKRSRRRELLVVGRPQSSPPRTRAKPPSGSRRSAGCTLGWRPKPDSPCIPTRVSSVR